MVLLSREEQLPIPLGPARGVMISVALGSGIWGMLFLLVAWLG